MLILCYSHKGSLMIISFQTTWKFALLKNICRHGIEKQFAHQMVLLPSWLLLNEEIWEICFPKAALWRHQAHQDTVPPPPVVSAELISATQCYIQRKSPNRTKKSQKKDSTSHISACENYFRRLHCLLTGAPQTHTCFPGWPESSLHTSLYAPGHTQGLFQTDHLDIDFSCDSEFWCLSAWGPWENCKHKPKAFCRESNHCDYFIKSNSFCSRKMEAKFTLSFRNVCDCSQSCSQCHLIFCKTA